MIHPRDLLADIASDTPFQPATSLWRAVELAYVINTDFPEGRGLDIGCGDGQVMKRILQHVGRRELVGIDLDPRETAVALASGVYAAVHTCPADHVPEPDASFDFAFSNSVLEHIPDLEGVFRETARVLKPGGTLLFTVPATTFPGALWGPLIPWQSRGAYEAMVGKRLAIEHLYSDAWSRDWLEPAGFEIEAVVWYLGRRAVRRWEFLARITAGVLYTVSRGRRQPIEIQRALSLRERRGGLFAAVAVLATRMLSIGALEDAPPNGTYTGVLVRARKRPA